MIPRPPAAPAASQPAPPAVRGSASRGSRRRRQHWGRENGTGRPGAGLRRRKLEAKEGRHILWEGNVLASCTRVRAISFASFFTSGTRPPFRPPVSPPPTPRRGNTWQIAFFCGKGWRFTGTGFRQGGGERTGTTGSGLRSGAVPLPTFSARLRQLGHLGAAWQSSASRRDRH